VYGELEITFDYNSLVHEIIICSTFSGTTEIPYRNLSKYSFFGLTGEKNNPE
jgi:hypothetical protein